MYEAAIDTAKKYLIFRPMTPNAEDILISGNAHVVSSVDTGLDPQGQQLTCFLGGVIGIGSRIFDRADDLLVARKLVNGCIWAYRSMPCGIMPERFHVVPCNDSASCEWDEKKWHAGIANHNENFKVDDEGVAERIKELGLFPGFTAITDRRCLLR
jgi:mannosyl-oligosaccharide alpha-1,2-mannosidase